MLLPVYRLAAGFAHRLPLAPRALATAVAGRRTSEVRWCRWAEEHRGSGPLIWIHAASVGEAQTATPVVTRLRAAVPGLQIVHSYSSPSAANWPAPFARDRADYIPLDQHGTVMRVLDAVRPSVVVFARGDLWPEFVSQLGTRSVPMALIGGSVRPGSLRLREPIRRLYAEMLRAVSWVGAASRGDAARLRKMGALDERLTISGDPRHDQVLERVTNLSAIHEALGWSAEGPTIVAGSLEASDEPVLLGAASMVLSTEPRARFLLVPHSSERQAVERLAAGAASRGLDTSIWTSDRSGRPSGGCVVVGAHGVLFDLYALGSMAYVGGGFRRGRLHAVIEPAAYGLPVVVGPYWQTSPDAEALIRAGGAVALAPRSSGAALAGAWLSWIGDERARSLAGLAARGSLARGAAALSAARILQLLE